MEQEEQFNPQQSLQLIEGMINKAKNRFAENGFLYLLWGWVIFICSTGHFLLLKFPIKAIKQPEIIWMLTWLAVIFQIIYLSKKSKQETTKTYTDEIIIYIWVTFGVCLGIATFLTGRNDTWQSMYQIILMLYGIPTFLSGIVMQFKPLKIGGICCWVLSIASSFVGSLYTLLLLAAAVVVAWIIPGYLLRAKYKKENA